MLVLRAVRVPSALILAQPRGHVLCIDDGMETWRGQGRPQGHSWSPEWGGQQNQEVLGDFKKEIGGSENTRMAGDRGTERLEGGRRLNVY